jgi:hypothetical protein
VLVTGSNVLINYTYIKYKTEANKPNKTPKYLLQVRARPVFMNAKAGDSPA